jgi:hypothetical protein
LYICLLKINFFQHLQNIQAQNVSHAAILQPGTSLAGHQYILKQQQLQQQIQQPQATANQIKTLGSPMPPPSLSPMNHPVGSPLVAQGSPMAMVARSPQPPSPHVQQAVLQQAPSPIGNTRYVSANTLPCLLSFFVINVF